MHNDREAELRSEAIAKAPTTPCRFAVCWVYSELSCRNRVKNFHMLSSTAWMDVCMFRTGYDIVTFLCADTHYRQLEGGERGHNDFAGKKDILKCYFPIPIVSTQTTSSKILVVEWGSLRC